MEIEEIKERYNRELMAAMKAKAKTTALEALELWAAGACDTPTSRVMPEGWGNEERDETRDYRTDAAYAFVQKFLEEKQLATPQIRSLLIHLYRNGGDPKSHKALIRRSETIEVPLDQVAELRAFGWDLGSYYEATHRRIVKLLTAYVLHRKWTIPNMVSV